MITRIQNILLKHNKWLFSALLVVIIVTFVLTIGNQNFGGHRTFESESVDYYGYDLTDGTTVRLIQQHAQLSMAMDPEMASSLAFRRSVGGAQDYALLRIAALGLANQVGIPEPTEEELKDFLRSRSRFLNSDTGAFDTNLYTQFSDLLRSTPQFTDGMVMRVLQEDYRIAHVREALSGPGYILPVEGQKRFLEQESEWTVKVATYDYADFSPEIVVEEADIVAFYEQNPLRYTLPERLQTSVVRFKASNFTDQVPAPSEAAITSYFTSNSFRYQPRQEPDAPEPAPITLNDVRERVTADYINERAAQIARASSETFSVYLYESAIARDSEEFIQAIEDNGAAVETLPPYSFDNTQMIAGLRPDLLNSAWVLAQGDRYFSDLAETADGAALIIYEATLPEELQSLETVRTSVEASWTAEEKRRLFTEQVTLWEDSITEAATDGAAFKATTEALGFEVTEPETFTAADRPASLRGRAWDVVRQLDSSEVSELIVTEPSAVIAFIEEKNTPPDLASTAQALFKNSVADDRESTGGWYVLREWTSKTLAQLEPEEEAL